MKQEKICKNCKELKPLQDFYVDNAKKDKHSSYCKICDKLKTKKWKKENPQKVKNHYRNNKAKYKQRNKNSRERNKEFISKVLENSECEDCGEENKVVLEFDHIQGDKINNISDMAHEGYSLKSLKQEIEKCEIVCANCHRIRTHKRRKN